MRAHILYKTSNTVRKKPDGRQLALWKSFLDVPDKVSEDVLTIVYKA